MSQAAKEAKKSELFGFGKGWGTILYCLLMFWFYAGMVNDSSNIVAPAVAEKLGIAAGSVLNMGTVAAMVVVVIFIKEHEYNRDFMTEQEIEKLTKELMQ